MNHNRFSFHAFFSIIGALFLAAAILFPVHVAISADSDATTQPSPPHNYGTHPRYSDVLVQNPGILPGNRTVTPVGQMQLTPNFPIGVIRVGSNVVVDCAGESFTSDLLVFDAASLKQLSQLPVYKTRPYRDEDQGNGLPNQNLFQGMTADAAGHLFVSGGYSDNILEMNIQAGKLHLLKTFKLAFQPFPSSQYPYEYQGDHWETPWLFYPDSLVLDPTGRYLYVTGLTSNSLAQIDLTSGHTIYANAGSYPYQVVLVDNGAKAVVSDWGDNCVTVLDAKTLRNLGEIAVGPPTSPTNRLPGVHPTGMTCDPASSLVWVACANSDVITQIDADAMKVIAEVTDEPYPGAGPGSQPEALAFDDGKLYVANSGNDDIAIFDPQSGSQLGLIPTGWYPSDLTIQSGKLYVVAAKGMGSGPNIHSHRSAVEVMPGTLQGIPLSDISSNLASWTYEALKDDHFDDTTREQLAASNAIAAGWIQSHLKYVVLILRENKTFDEDLGTYARAGAWADPNLDLYDRKELPNLYSMADHYALFVNFYDEGEVTAQAHQWVTAAEDSDFVERTWPMNYSFRGLPSNPGWTFSLVADEERFDKKTNSFNGADNPFATNMNLSALGHWGNPWIAYPRDSYLFDSLLARNVSFEDFGEFVSRDEAGDISPQMKAHIATSFPGWNRFILDTFRAGVATKFIQDHPNDLPRFMYIWLPDDHTAGQNPGYYTPDAYVANNDFATAQVIAALSKTPQWKQMAVFILEDDTQSGSDHIDAHRSFALAISPWVKPGALITRHYSQVDVMHTMETILGVPPLSQWDANAAIMGDIWTNQPDFSPLQVLPQQVQLAMNPGKPYPGDDLRLKAGKTGDWLSPQWLKDHPQNQSSADSQPVYFTPTQTVEDGPEQLRQEWIASKGVASYQKLMNYIQSLAKKQNQPITHFIAAADKDDDDGD
ncbi:MAG TPA: bifunctional YncE family protein/alkaline phosphatase family protein [Phycisphaerae bacterium]|nr:bifunctional YncE family protein/alkaline phosphatase family protein [Phycisphaerae bacterium]